MFMTLMCTLAAAGCNDGDDPEAPQSEGPMSLQEHLRESYDSSFDATYVAEVGSDTWNVRWVKDGTTRQAFEISGEGPLFDRHGDITVIIPSDIAKTTLCASRAGAFSDALTEPACCEGDSQLCGDAGDTGANIVAGSLGYTLAYPEELRDDESAFEGVIVRDAAPRAIAGVEAQCFNIAIEGEQLPPNTPQPEWCFGPGGVELFRNGTTPFNTIKLEAQSFSSDIDESAFEYPFELIPTEDP
jgi:hypothetical protein